MHPAQPGGVSNYRVLIVDDNPSIHDDFRKILCPENNAGARLAEMEALIFSTPVETTTNVTFELDSAFQGEEALKKLNEALAGGRPYALAFVDIQMPPGWDGVETINRLWDVYPGLQVVICTAYSTYSFDHMRSVLNQPDSLLILKKPFDGVEIQQMAHTLVRKWELNLHAGMGLDRLSVGIRNLLASNREILPAAAAYVSDHPNDIQIVTILERLSHMLEAARGQLRHAEQALVHSEKMASLGRLCAGILHEINNPLNQSLAALSVLERDEEIQREDHLDALKDIRNGFLRMMDITGGLRKFAHPDMGELHKIKVNESIHTSLSLMAAEIGEDIQVDNRISDDVSVWGSAPRMSQVFINLIQNSTHALRKKDQPPGTAARLIFESAKQDGRLVISITDNGTGILPAELGKIFDPFYTSKDVGEGVGLGLGICHQILQQFGATISAESEWGAYTRFNISFPDPETYIPPKQTWKPG